jgi:hypothetical protein
MTLTCAYGLYGRLLHYMRMHLGSEGGGAHRAIVLPRDFTIATTNGKGA